MQLSKSVARPWGRPRRRRAELLISAKQSTDILHGINSVASHPPLPSPPPSLQTQPLPSPIHVVVYSCFAPNRLTWPFKPGLGLAGSWSNARGPRGTFFIVRGSCMQVIRTGQLPNSREFVGFGRNGGEGIRSVIYFHNVAGAFRTSQSGVNLKYPCWLN